jgi:hypothetical protein
MNPVRPGVDHPVGGGACKQGDLFSESYRMGRGLETKGDNEMPRKARVSLSFSGRGLAPKNEQTIKMRCTPALRRDERRRGVRLTL